MAITEMIINGFIFGAVGLVTIFLAVFIFHLFSIPARWDREKSEEIERLRAHVAELEAREKRLVAVLEGIASSLDEAMPNEYESLAVEMRDEARATLNEVKGGDDDG